MSVEDRCVFCGDEAFGIDRDGELTCDNSSCVSAVRPLPAEERAKWRLEFAGYTDEPDSMAVYREREH